jgi:hypothetical protein
MGKNVIKLIVVFSIVVLLIVSREAGGGRIVKNSIGNFLGYGTCPNCGDSWRWKESSFICYGQLEEGKDYTIKGNIPGAFFGGISSAVMICKECLLHPKSLNPDKIEKDLINSSWELRQAALAKIAVAHYKEVHECLK